MARRERPLSAPPVLGNAAAVVRPAPVRAGPVITAQPTAQVVGPAAAAGSINSEAAPLLAEQDLETAAPAITRTCFESFSQCCSASCTSIWQMTRVITTPAARSVTFQTTLAGLHRYVVTHHQARHLHPGGIAGMASGLVGCLISGFCRANQHRPGVPERHMREEMLNAEIAQAAAEGLDVSYARRFMRAFAEAIPDGLAMVGTGIIHDALSRALDHTSLTQQNMLLVGAGVTPIITLILSLIMRWFVRGIACCFGQNYQAQPIHWPRMIGNMILVTLGSVLAILVSSATGLTGTALFATQLSINVVSTIFSLLIVESAAHCIPQSLQDRYARTEVYCQDHCWRPCTESTRSCSDLLINRIRSIGRCFGGDDYRGSYGRI